jgi:magnesium transporter
MNPLARLGAAFLKDHPEAAAGVLEDFPAENVARFLVGTSPVTALQIIRHFTPAFAANCLLAGEPAAAGSIFAQLPPDFQVMILRQLERAKRESLLSTLAPDLSTSLRRLLPYPQGTAGAVMEAALASVPEELTVRHAVKRIKRMRRGLKFYVYVTNQQGQLTGVLTLHELINALPSSSIAQVMSRAVVRLSPQEPLPSVINSPYWQEFHALPVTDDDNVLLGVIRQKSLRRFQEQAVQVGAVSGSLGAFVAVGELFSISAGHLLAALIATGASATKRREHD